MTGETEYRIVFQIERRLPGEDDFIEVGFGSSGAWNTLAGASYDMESAIEHRQWETEPGQPDPDDI